MGLFLEERKMDHLVRQNEGGRKMTNQIVREVFQTHGNKAKKLAFGQSVSIFQAHRGSPPHFIDLTTTPRGDTFFYVFYFTKKFFLHATLNVKRGKVLSTLCVVFPSSFEAFEVDLGCVRL